MVWAGASLVVMLGMLVAVPFIHARQKTRRAPDQASISEAPRKPA